jgi:hypothetical protein
MILFFRMAGIRDNVISFSKNKTIRTKTFDFQNGWN